MTGPDVSDLYKHLSTQSLLDLQAAFEIDLARGGDQAFIRGRLALIARELRTRGPIDQRP